MSKQTLCISNYTKAETVLHFFTSLVRISCVTLYMYGAGNLRGVHNTPVTFIYMSQAVS